MKKQESDKERKDLERAEEAINKSESMKKEIFSRTMDFSGEEESLPDSGRMEAMVDAMHQVSRMNKNKAVVRLLEELKKKERRKRMAHVWWYVSAAVVISFVMMAWLRFDEKPEEKLSPVIALTEIKVPTLISMKNDHDILSQETLDVKNAEVGFVVGVASVEEMEETTVVEKQVRYSRIVIPAGYTYKVQLADGSVVTLNAGSELRFPEEFRDSVREVELKGEGYFDVEKSDKPFIVKAGETQVKVYGTRFNMFYSEKLALSEAVLVEGRIGMTAGGKETKIEPNQRVYCSLEDSLLRFEDVDPSDYIGWLGSSFKYNKVRLDKIVFDISQWYGVNIKLAPGSGEQTYSLEFDKSSTIGWVVRALGLIINKPIKKEGGEYYIE